jgi:hypothetical protein
MQFDQLKRRQFITLIGARPQRGRSRRAAGARSETRIAFLGARG